MQSTLVRTLQTTESRVGIDGLVACQSYWLVVTAIDSICNTQLRTSPQQIGLYQSMTFKFAISLQDSTPCREWIAENSATKLSDVKDLITSDSPCEVLTPCLVNGQFTCEGNSDTITYE
jgi:hypothetical protein